MAMKEALEAKIDAWRPRTTRLIKEFGDVKVGDVTISQAIGAPAGSDAWSLTSPISTPMKAYASAGTPSRKP